MRYDFADYKIRTMVERDHNPQEHRDTSTIPITIRIECTMCHERWPCPSTLALRDFETERRKTQYQKMAEQGYQDGPPPW